MSPRDVFVRALRSLCDAEGGPEKVADEAGVSAENLRQILAGTLLPSGRPRGVGPAVQRKLDERYPGWWQLGELAKPPPTLNQAIPVVLEALSRLSALRWKAIQVTLGQVVGHPEMRDDVANEVIALLSAPLQSTGLLDWTRQEADPAIGKRTGSG